MRALAIVGMLGLVPALGAQEITRETAEKRFQGFLSTMEKLVEVLKESKDEKTAKDNLPKLRELEKELAGFNKTTQEMPRDIAQGLIKKFRERTQKLNRSLEAEMTRIQGKPELLKVLKDLRLVQNFERVEKTRAKVAELQMKTLEQALELYKLTHGEYPEELRALTKRTDKRDPYVEEGSLNDPWGRPYRYASSGHPENKNRPKLWSLGPSGTKKTLIGNWKPKD